MIQFILLFIVSPIASFLGSIRYVLQQPKLIYMIGTFLALFFSYLPPTSDAYRYREIYYESVNYHFHFESLWSTEQDFLYPLLSSLFCPFGVPFELFRFIIILPCVLLFCWIFLDIVKKERYITKNKKLLALSIFALFFSIRYFTIVTGIRFGVASLLAVVAIYLLSEKRFVVGGVLFLSAMFMHVSMLLLLPVIILSFLTQGIKWSATKQFLLILGCLLLARTAVGDMLTYFFSGNELVMRKTTGYIDGAWGTEALLESASWGGLMFSYLRIFPIIPLAYFSIKYARKSFLLNVAFFLTLLLCVSLSSITLLLRYSSVGIYLYLIVFLQNLSYLKKTFVKLKIVVVTLLISLGCYVYSQRYVLSDLHLNYLVIISPFTLIDNYTYSDDWVMQHIDLNGELKN